MVLQRPLIRDVALVTQPRDRSGDARPEQDLETVVDENEAWFCSCVALGESGHVTIRWWPSTGHLLKSTVGILDLDAGQLRLLSGAFREICTAVTGGPPPNARWMVACEAAGRPLNHLD